MFISTLKYKRNGRLLVQLAVVAYALAGCGDRTEQDHLARAKAFVANKEFASAIVTMKDMLQHQPNSAEARYLLGKALLASGEAKLARIELEKAAELKFNEELVLPELARSLLATREDKKLIALSANTSLKEPTADADIKTSVALALLRQGSQEPAADLLKAALQAAPAFVPARLLDARWKASIGDFPAASAIVDDILSKAPDVHEAWQIKGDIALQERADMAAAIQAYRKALAISPSFMPAHRAIIATLMKSHDVEGMRAQVNQVQKIAPRDPRTLYFSAQLAFLERDVRKAREITQLLLRHTPDDVLILQQAGAIELQGGALVQAATYLNRALKIYPNLPTARRMLAQTYLQEGRAEKAIETLGPLLEGQKPSADTLTIAAEAMLVKGDPIAAERYFAAALERDPTDIKIRTAVALAHFDTSNAETASAELEAIAKADAGTIADMALVSARMRRKDLPAALHALSDLEKKTPGKPLPHHLRGRVLMAQSNMAGAQASFEQALKIDPFFFPSISSLAAIDQANNRPELARQRFEALLKKDPKSVEALVAMAGFKNSTGGKPAEIEALLRLAISYESADAAPRLLLIDHLLDKHNFKEALTAAQEASNSIPGNKNVTAALGRAQFKAGDNRQSILTFQRLVAAEPKSPEPLLRLAAVYLATNNKAEADKTYKRALDLSPNSAVAQASLIALALEGRRFDDARQLSRVMQRGQKTSATGWVYEGDIEFARRSFGAASTAYRTAYAKERSTAIAIKLHRSLLVGAQSNEADHLAAELQKTFPRDGGLQMYLGDTALLREDYAGAEQKYRTAMELQPNNALVFNNLSYVLLKQHKPGAVELAERANKMTPNSPSLMDTWAMALANEGQTKQAADLLKRAIEISPATPGLKLNLARVYIKSGEKPKARELLEGLRALGKKFPAQPEVSKLLEAAS